MFPVLVIPNVFIVGLVQAASLSFIDAVLLNWFPLDQVYFFSIFIYISQVLDYWCNCFMVIIHFSFDAKRVILPWVLISLLIFIFSWQDRLLQTAFVLVLFHIFSLSKAISGEQQAHAIERWRQETFQKHWMLPSLTEWALPY